MSKPKDTNQASELYELCKEVYKRTGWSDTLVKHSKDKHAPNPLVVETVYEKYVGVYENAVGCDECEGEYSLEGLTPLYTSDYLLEKLPHYSPTAIHRLTLQPVANHGMWAASYDDTNRRESSVGVHSADTPLKALLKLTIALSEAGELK